MKDSSGLLEDMPALRARLHEDGYVYLRGVLDRRKVGTWGNTYIHAGKHARTHARTVDSTNETHVTLSARRVTGHGGAACGG